jgi:hypothetical protein
MLPSQHTKTDSNARQTNKNEKQRPITAPTRNWRFSASYDSFVVKQIFVLRISICARNRHFCQAETISS